MRRARPFSRPWSKSCVTSIASAAANHRQPKPTHQNKSLMLNNSPAPTNVISAAGALSQWLRQALIVLLVTAVLILVIGQYTDLDLILADLYFDTEQELFPWDKTWFARDFMHGYLKNVIIWLGYLLLGTVLLDAIRPFARLDRITRVKLRIITLAAILAPALIRTLKGASNLHCPWGIKRYGGSHSFLRLLDAVPEGWSAGHCFPAGHASVSMWFCVLAVIWLPHAPRRATAAFAGGLMVGMGMGWVQQMRGQHFLTHTLWTAWLSSAVVIILIALYSRQLCKHVDENVGRPT